MVAVPPFYWRMICLRPDLPTLGNVVDCCGNLLRRTIVEEVSLGRDDT